jgi:predicted O-methyltransferase YrrM
VIAPHRRRRLGASGGGVIVLDNMLRRGRVADPNDTDADTCALRKLNMKIASDPRVDHVLLAIASGVTLVQRRQ